MPVLRRPTRRPEDGIREYNYLLKYEEPQPFYECDYCKMAEEVRKQNIIIEDWNNKQK